MNELIEQRSIEYVPIRERHGKLWHLSFFMAFHSTQGPQLGLPQMIQSRPQFGYVGALLVWCVALTDGVWPYGRNWYMWQRSLSMERPWMDSVRSLRRYSGVAGNRCPRSRL